MHRNFERRVHYEKSKSNLGCYVGYLYCAEYYAGAIVTLVDDTVNHVSGCNIFRILKTQYKSGSTSVQKKRLKIDGAFYSYQSMNIQGGSKGTGVLNITSGFEGMNSELHLTINGANYACEEDYENMGIYQFVDGQLVTTFTSDSYVAVKEQDNANWYMFQSYVQTTSGTLYNTNTGASESPAA